MNDDYSSPTWNPEGSKVTFHFSKRRVIQAWELMDQLREIGLEQQLDIAQMADFIPVMMGASHAKMKVLRKELFTTVKYEDDGLPAQPVLGNEDTAFRDLTPDDVYTVMLRSLAVNFTSGSSMTGTDGESGA